jgi:hypothetical protein
MRTYDPVPMGIKHSLLTGCIHSLSLVKILYKELSVTKDNMETTVWQTKLNIFWVDASADGLLVPEGLYNPVAK